MTLNDRDETIRQLLDVARKNELSALQETLRVIAQHAHAIGAVIWEVVQARNVAEQDRRLMVLGSWFENPDDGVWYYLTLEKSLTGQTIARKQPYFSETVGTESLTPQKAKKTLQSMGFKTSLLVPVDLTQFNTKACINFYWKSEIALDKAAQKEIASICSLLPDLYAALVDRVGLKLLQSLNRTLRQKKYSAKDSVDVQPQDAVQHALQEVVTLISSVFNCREVCIFLLNERRQDRTSVVLKAKHWEWEDPPIKSEYKEGEGLTGYTLKTKERVRIHDLVFFDEDYPYISGNYPGIQWNASEVLQKSARALLKLPPEADLPPISFMAVPIFGGGQLLGVIRCCAARNAPYFFDNRQVDVLKLAADSLGVWRQDWLDRAQTDVENEDWREVTQKLAYLNGFVHSELTQRSPNESKILKAAMQATADLIAETPALDVRLRKDNHLYVAETSGDLWDKGSWTEKEQRKSRIFSLAEGARKSAAALVYKTKKLHVVESPADTNYDATFPEVKKAILAPLVCGKDIYGTLGVRRVTDVPFAEHEKVVVELLANQLGLYHFLADEISELNKTKETLQSTVDSQTRMYEVFGHQVRSPIVQASRTIQDVVESASISADLGEKLLAVQGLCAQAERVARNLDLFVSLAREKPINLGLKTITAKALAAKLQAAARDHQVVIAKYRNIRFELNEKSFENIHSLRADQRLLEQAINNLLENAGKYSYADTKVEIIVGSMDNHANYFISVSNQGLPIRGDEIKKVVEHEYRSEAARQTADGHGIGLWIVDKIMQAHGGRLMIIPTTDKNITDVRLVFPKTLGR